MYYFRDKNFLSTATLPLHSNTCYSLVSYGVSSIPATYSKNVRLLSCVTFIAQSHIIDIVYLINWFIESTSKLYIEKF